MAFDWADILQIYVPNTVQYSVWKCVSGDFCTVHCSLYSIHISAFICPHGVYALDYVLYVCWLCWCSPFTLGSQTSGFLLKARLMGVNQNSSELQARGSTNDIKGPKRLHKSKNISEWHFKVGDWPSSGLNVNDWRVKNPNFVKALWWPVPSFLAVTGTTLFPHNSLAQTMCRIFVSVLPTSPAALSVHSFCSSIKLRMKTGLWHIQ